MQSKDAGGKGDLPKSAELEELLWRWSQGFLSLGFSRGEGFSNERSGGKRRIWMQKGKGLTAGAPRANRGWEMSKSFVKATKERNG